MAAKKPKNDVEWGSAFTSKDQETTHDDLISYQRARAVLHEATDKARRLEQLRPQVSSKGVTLNDAIYFTPNEAAQPRTNMDGGLERLPDCTGFWVQIEVDIMTPQTARFVHIIDNGVMAYRYLDDARTEYTPLEVLRKGSNIVYLFLWELEML